MPNAIPPRSVAPLSALRNRLILVVEDEYVVAQDIQSELEAAGAEVLGPAPTVTDALTLLAGSAALDAAILDVNLKGELVFPVAAALRKRDVPFVFVTGYEWWMLPTAYTNVRCCEKPFDVGRCLSGLFAHKARR